MTTDTTIILKQIKYLREKLELAEQNTLLNIAKNQKDIMECMAKIMKTLYDTALILVDIKEKISDTPKIEEHKCKCHGNVV